MGWLGEFSSMFLSMGQKLINGAERGASELTASELEKGNYFQTQHNLQAISLAYKPLDSA